MSLPRNIPYNLLLTQWPQQLDPLLANAVTQGVAISGVTLNGGVPKTFATGLGRQQQGWFITDILSNAVVWRTQPMNDKTLTLESNNDTTVSIWVF